MRRILLGIILAALVGGLGAGWVAAKHHPAQEKVTIVGSTALQPLAEAVAARYRQGQPTTNITVQGGGSGTGLSQVQAGAVNIGSADIFASQQDGIDAHKLRDQVGS